MERLRIHYLQHVPFEGLGYIENWALEHKCVVSVTRLYLGEVLPDIHSFDWLIIMGGPMGVYDEAQFPWLGKEKEFIRRTIDRGKTVIGICLGAQLIAAVLGARVYPNAEKEIGWFDVQLTAEGKDCRLLEGFAGRFPVFHWHGDTFDLPGGAVRLMQSEACLNQAFLYQNRVLGLQFHFEATPLSVKDMVNNGMHELINAQSSAQILSSDHCYDENHNRLAAIFNRLSARADFYR